MISWSPIVKKKNPIAVKKFIENRQIFNEKLIFEGLRHFSRAFFKFPNLACFYIL